jgi:hypothetical protein
MIPPIAPAAFPDRERSGLMRGPEVIDNRRTSQGDDARRACCAAQLPEEDRPAIVVEA